MFGLRYYFVAIVLFYMYERKLSKRLWLILGSYFLFVLTSAVLLNYRLLEDKYLLFYYNFINETIITILLIIYLIWKAIEIHKNRTKDEVYKFLHNSTFTIWLILIAVWWILCSMPTTMSSSKVYFMLIILISSAFKLVWL